MGSNCKLEGQVALITGSSRNIGKTTALAFAREGAKLVLNTRVNQEELEAAAAECRELGAEVVSVLADVSEFDEVNRLVKAGLDHFGKIDILVSNVGIRPHKSIIETTVEEWRHVLAVNLDATFYLCKAVLPGMIEQHHGSIIALGGHCGFLGRSNMPAVSASKGGLQGLIKGMAVDYGSYGIRANLVIPYQLSTERRYAEWYTEWESGRAEFEKKLVQRIPLGRLGTSEEVASLILFLASSDSSFITGQHIMCNGGRDM